MKLEETNEMKLFYQRLNKINETKKSNFTLDFDNFSDKKLLILYAKIFAFFLNNKTDFKRELDKKQFIRPFKSSTKSKGYHIKIYQENTWLENIFFRAKFNDDRRRLTTDIKRFNMNIGNIGNNTDKLFYDVAFKEKIINGIKHKKSFELINVLDIVGIKRKTFYKLVEAIQNKDNAKIVRILKSVNTIVNDKFDENIKNDIVFE